MRRVWLGLLALLIAGPAFAASDVGIYQRTDCTSISNPVQGRSFCFDQTANALKFWNGTSWVASGSSSTPVNVSSLATSGSGTLASPWIGYEAGVNALAEASQIYFGGGYYRQATSVDYKNDWTVKGEGRNSIILATDVALNPFVCNGKTRLALLDLSFQGPTGAAGDENTGNVAHFLNCNTILVSGLYATGMNGGITFATSLKGTVIGNILEGAKAYALYINSSTQILAAANQFLSAWSGNTGIQTNSLGASRSANVSLDGNYIRNTSNGIQVRGTDHVTVTGNMVFVTAPGDYHNGIGFNNSTNLTITGNTVDGGGALTSVLYVADSSNIVTIAGNVIRSAGRDGMQVGSADTLHATISGNMVYQGGNSGSGGAGFRIDTNDGAARANRFTIADNVVEGFAGHCINVIGNAANYLSITGNRFYDCSQRGMNLDLLGYATISNNLVHGAGATQANYINCNYCTISGNTILDSDGPNAFGLNLLGTGNLVTGNVITQKDTTGQDYAIRDQSGTSKIYNNVLTGNQVAPISVVGGTTDYRQPGRVTVTFSATPTFDVSQGDQIELAAMTANITGITISNAYKGQIWTVTFTQGGSGSYTIAGWPASVLLSGAAFTPTVTVGAKSSLTFRYDGTNHVEIARDLDVR